jgi:hypothetical protein
MLGIRITVGTEGTAFENEAEEGQGSTPLLGLFDTSVYSEAGSCEVSLRGTFGMPLFVASGKLWSVGCVPVSSLVFAAASALMPGSRSPDPRRSRLLEETDLVTLLGR